MMIENQRLSREFIFCGHVRPEDYENSSLPSSPIASVAFVYRFWAAYAECYPEKNVWAGGRSAYQ